MSKKPHKDDEKRPNAAAMIALDKWMLVRNITRKTLAPIWDVSAAQVGLVFAGRGYLSRTQRRATEKFSEGTVTEKMLLGVQVPPSRILPPDPIDEDGDDEPADETFGGAVGEAEDVETFLGQLATEAMPDALRLIARQMRSAKSDSERRRCAEILIEQFRGKPRQVEEKKSEPDHVLEEDLLDRLLLVETRLTRADETDPEREEYLGEGVA